MDGLEKCLTPLCLRACISGALQGCRAILSCEAQQRGTDLPIDSIVSLETKLFREVPIASLSQENRYGSLELLLAVLQVKAFCVEVEDSLSLSNSQGLVN